MLLLVSLELEAVSAWALQPLEEPPLEATLEPEGWLRLPRLLGA